MKKRTIGVFVMLFLLINPLVLADHGFWNEVKDAFKENIAGQASVGKYLLSDLPDGERFTVQFEGEEYTYRRNGNSLERKTGWFSWEGVPLGRAPTMEDVKGDVLQQIGFTSEEVPLRASVVMNTNGMVDFSESVIFQYPEYSPEEEPVGTPIEVHSLGNRIEVVAGEDILERYQLAGSGTLGGEEVGVFYQIEEVEGNQRYILENPVTYRDGQLVPVMFVDNQLEEVMLVEAPQSPDVDPEAGTAPMAGSPPGSVGPLGSAAPVMGVPGALLAMIGPLMMANPPEIFIDDEGYQWKKEGDTYIYTSSDGNTLTGTLTDNQITVTEGTGAYAVDGTNTIPVGTIFGSLSAFTEDNIIIAHDDITLEVSLRAAGFSPEANKYAEGEWSKFTKPDGSVATSAVEAALIDYQKQNELTADGVAGKLTKRSLNRKVDEVRAGPSALGVASIVDPATAAPATPSGIAPLSPVTTVTATTTTPNWVITTNLDGSFMVKTKNNREYTYTPVENQRLGDKQVYTQGSGASQEWFVQEGNKFVKVKKDGAGWKYLKVDKTLTDNVAEAVPSGLIDGTKVVLVAAPAVAPSAPTPPPSAPPSPDFLLKKYLGEKEFDAISSEGKLLNVDGNVVTFYSDKDKKNKIASYTIVGDPFISGVAKIEHLTFDETGKVTSTTFEYRNTMGEMLVSRTPEQEKAGTFRLQGIDEDVVLASGTYVNAIFDNTDSSKTFDVYRDAAAREQGEKKRKAYIVSHASAESVTFGVIDDGFSFDEGTITTWNKDSKTLLQKEEFSGSTASTESEITYYRDDGTVIGQYHADYDNNIKKQGDKYGNDVIELYQGGIIVGKTTLDTKGKPTSTIIYQGDGNYLVTEYDDKGNIKETKQCDTGCNFHGNGQIAAELKENVEDFGPEDFFGTIYTITDSIKSYPAISNLIFNEAANASWYDDWVRTNDELMAPFLGREWFPSAVCEGPKHDITPEGTAMLLAPGGTNQPVASIQAEKSTDQAPILCQLNQEQVWDCERKQVCLNDEFCYADQDEDGRADDPDAPLIATFYTISWGVTAPRDEALTPFIDENGVAVSFNVVIEEAVGGSACLPAATGTVRPLYRETLHLSRGASLKDVITRYSEKDYGRVWIQWERPPLTRSSGFLTGTGTSKDTSLIHTGSYPIEDVCYPITVSNRGKVNWESLVSEGGSPSSASTTDAVSLRSDGW